MSPSSPRRAGVLGIALLGLVPVIGIAATSAAFTDAAQLTLGASATGQGIGNPDLFDLAVLDDDSAYQDAATEGEAVVLTTAGSALLSETHPLVMLVSIANRPTSPVGDVAIELYDPDPGTDDVFDHLRFDVHLGDEPAPAITDASADEVNQAGLVLESLQTDEVRTVRLEVLLDEVPAIPGAGTRIGLRGLGETR